MKELKSNKQEAFAQALAFEDITKTDAYKRAYPTCVKNKWADKTIWQHACDLSKVEKVKRRIEDLKSTVTKKTIEEIVYTREQSFKVFDENIALLKKELEEVKTLDTKERVSLTNALLKNIKEQEEQKAKLYSLFVNKVELDIGIKESLRKFINRKKRIEDET